MARGRMISKSLSTSEKFAALGGVAGPLTEFCQTLYPLIVAHSDDFGRLQGDTFTIKLMCFPSSPRSTEEFHTALTHLHDVGLIVRYTVESKLYIQIVKFDPHQSGLHHRTRSQFPRIPDGSRDEHDPVEQEKRTQQKRTEGKRSTPLPPKGGRSRTRARGATQPPDGRYFDWQCPHDPKCGNRASCAVVSARRA